MNGIYDALSQYLATQPQGMTSWNSFLTQRYPSQNGRQSRFLRDLTRRGLYAAAPSGGGTTPVPSLPNYSPMIPEDALKTVDVGLQANLLALAQGKDPYKKKK